MVEAHSDAWPFPFPQPPLPANLSLGGSNLWKSSRMTSTVRRSGSDSASPEGVHSQQSERPEGILVSSCPAKLASHSLHISELSPKGVRAPMLSAYYHVLGTAWAQGTAVVPMRLHSYPVPFLFCQLLRLGLCFIPTGRFSFSKKYLQDGHRGRRTRKMSHVVHSL